MYENAEQEVKMVLYALVIIKTTVALENSIMYILLHRIHKKKLLEFLFHMTFSQQ